MTANRTVSESKRDLASCQVKCYLKLMKKMSTTQMFKRISVAVASIGLVVAGYRYRRIVDSSHRPSGDAQAGTINPRPLNQLLVLALISPSRTTMYQA